MSWKRIFLYLLIASVALSAILGIAVVLFGTMGERETRILLTSLTITCMSLLGVACGANLEAARFPKSVPIAGMIFAVISAAIWIAIVWSAWQGGEYWVKSSFTVTLLASAISYCCLLGLASLDRRFRWSQLVSYLTAAGLTGLLLHTIWINDNPGEFTGRMIAALSIVIGAFTVIVPIFHRLSSGDDPLARVENEIESLKKRLVELEERRNKLTKGDEESA